MKSVIQRTPVLVPRGQQPSAKQDDEPRRQLTELDRAFRDAAKLEKQRTLDANDSEHWFAVCFETREQKEEFLRKLHALQLGDKYINGLDLAESLSIELESPRLKPLKTRINRRWTRLVKEM